MEEHNSTRSEPCDGRHTTECTACRDEVTLVACELHLSEWLQASPLRGDMGSKSQGGNSGQN
jgi:hypothetical protein